MATGRRQAHEHRTRGVRFLAGRAAPDDVAVLAGRQRIGRHVERVARRSPRACLHRGGWCGHRAARRPSNRGGLRTASSSGRPSVRSRRPSSLGCSMRPTYEGARTSWFPLPANRGSGPGSAVSTCTVVPSHAVRDRRPGGRWRRFRLRRRRGRLVRSGWATGLIEEVQVYPATTDCRTPSVLQSARSRPSPSLQGGAGQRKLPVCPSEYRPGCGNTHTPCGPAPTGTLASSRPSRVDIA